MSRDLWAERQTTEFICHLGQETRKGNCWGKVVSELWGLSVLRSSTWAVSEPWRQKYGSTFVLDSKSLSVSSYICLFNETEIKRGQEEKSSPLLSSYSFYLLPCRVDCTVSRGGSGLPGWIGEKFSPGSRVFTPSLPIHPGRRYEFFLVISQLFIFFLAIQFFFCQAILFLKPKPCLYIYQIDFLKYNVFKAS